MSRSLNIGLTGFLLGVLAGYFVAPLEAEGTHRQLFYVQRAVDGDTLKGYFLQDVEQEIRLLNVDTPERGQEFYKDATQVTADMVEGEVVIIEAEKLDKRDKYGRFLGYVWGPEGKNLNVELVRRGMSFYYTKFGGGIYPDEFKKAEAEAREKKVGLWEE